VTATPELTTYPVVHERDGYTLVEEQDRLSAVTPEGVEIAGAHKPTGHEYWSVYVTASAVRASGHPCFPRHIHYHGLTAEHDSRVWVDFVAGLYTERAS